MSVETDVTKPPGLVILDANSQKVFWGQLISQTCDKLMSVGLIWVLTSRFDPRWVPWFIGLGALPHLLFASRSGRWINRWGALTTVIRADAFRGILYLVAAVLVLRADSDPLLLALLLVTTLVSNAAGSLFNPAILTLPVDMMDAGERRDKLTALIDSCFSFGNVLGPIVSVAAYAGAGLSGMLAINGLSYFFSAALALGVKLKPANAPAIEPSDDKGGEDSKAPDTKTFLQVMKDKPVISGMLITFLLMNFFLAPIMIFMPWYAKNVYFDGIAGLAKLEVFLAVGTVIGSTLLSFVQIPGALWKRITYSLMLMSLSYLAFTLSPNIVLACLSVAFLGFFLALANVIILTFFQSNPEPQEVPVVMGMVNLISVASLPVSMGIVGFVIDRVQVQSLAWICAAIVLAIALSIRFIPRIKTV